MNVEELNSSKKNWNLTSKLFIDWVSRNKVKKFLVENCIINGLSVWWVSKIVSKDNVNDKDWFIELKNKLINKNFSSSKKYFFWTLFLSRFFKNFIKNFIWIILIKIISFTRYRNYNIKNCFHSYNYNFFSQKKDFNDRLHGVLLSKSKIKNNFYLVTNIKKIFFIKNLLKFNINRKKIAISDEFISLKDLFKINFLIVKNLFILIIFIKRGKNLFSINKIDCSNILQSLLINSFCGELQDNYLNAIGIKKFLDKNKVTNFINYGEFSPGFRANYFYIRKSLSRPKIITFQHGHANFLYNFNKSAEFTKNNKKEGKLYSPSPDVYLVQGTKFSRILKKYFKKKVVVIGALKYDKVKFNKKINSELKQIKYNSKKNILVCPSIGDHYDILKLIKESYNSNYNYILSPHPTYRKEIMRIYLKTDIRFQTFKKFSTNELIKVSDLVLAGFSHTAIEAQILGVPSIRLININKPNYLDNSDKIKIIHKTEDLSEVLNLKEFKKYRIKNVKNVIKLNYYKLDNKSYERFLKNIN